MKELSIEEKAKAYDEALKVLHKYDGANIMFTQDLKEEMFPELKESEDEKMRRWIINYLDNKALNSGIIQEKTNIKNAIAWLEKQDENDDLPPVTDRETLDEYAYQVTYDLSNDWLKAIPTWDDVKTAVKLGAKWLEKQGEQKPYMIQWKGDNLKEVIDFVGKDKNFEKWFKSFEEYEKYVCDHNGIFKLFNADGSHYEIPVGAWIVKTPDGYNVASKAKYKQKPADKIEPKFHEGDKIHCKLDNRTFVIKEVDLENGVYRYTENGCGNDIDYADELFELVEQKPAWSEEDEMNLRRLMLYLSCREKIIPEVKSKYMDWFKSIKDRVQPQS